MVLYKDGTGCCRNVIHCFSCWNKITELFLLFSPVVHLGHLWFFLCWTIILKVLFPYWNVIIWQATTKKWRKGDLLLGQPCEGMFTCGCRVDVDHGEINVVFLQNCNCVWFFLSQTHCCYNNLIRNKMVKPRGHEFGISLDLFYQKGLGQGPVAAIR